jgi:hypothetical protein
MRDRTDHRNLPPVLVVGLLGMAATLLAVFVSPPAHAGAAGRAAGPNPAASATCSEAFLPLPDPSCTPGALNPDVKQSTIGSTICVSGWTATVRPPTSYTNPLKVQQIAQYGYTDTSTADYEEDHFIPLELGGAPRDPQNLWPEPRKAATGETASSKDGVETKLKNLVCNGTATLAAAQNALVDDWQTAVSVVSASARAAAVGVPRPDHVVVVMMENHSYRDIIGSSVAPYLNSLAAKGASFTQSFGVTHPSEPNYLALFSGSTHGLTSDSCPHTYTSDNLGKELIGAGDTFAGYSESMPSTGYTGCTSGAYARKHNPWVDFTSSVPAADNRTFAAFPSQYTSLPTVSFVVPNLKDDMHDGTVAAGDSWLKQHLSGYATWAATHNSLLIVTWDEDDNSAGNQIPTIFVGQHVKTGKYAESINHYDVLGTIEDAYGLPHAGSAATATPITDAWL